MGSLGQRMSLGSEMSGESALGTTPGGELGAIESSCDSAERVLFLASVSKTVVDVKSLISSGHSELDADDDDESESFCSW